jgi:lipid-A-disaccharide synthase
MRIFMSTGEASGDMAAAALAGAIRALCPEATFLGIGNERMQAAGCTLTARTDGWAAMGPLDAIGKIPALLMVMLRHAFMLRADPVDLIVLVDFGASNLRFAQTLRALGYTRPILYFFPPGAWLDNPRTAAVVARTALPLTAFAHQRDFYRSLGLDIAYFGHPLASLTPPRAQRSVPPSDAGVVALLPGSRCGEVRFHLPLLLRACTVLQAQRPRLEVLVSVADGTVAKLVDTLLRDVPDVCVRRVRGAREALDAADLAFIASGTAVLEATLRQTPTVALYVISNAQAKIARRVYQGRFITLPNLLLDRLLVPELLQEEAAPQKLADAGETLLRDPFMQRTGMHEVRERLGAPDALERCARFALEVARG